MTSFTRSPACVVVEISTTLGLGSDVILDTRGNVVTNAHVVGAATSFRVPLPNMASTYSARLVGAFTPDDLAVIRIADAHGLHPALLGDSNKLETVYIGMAVGNPLGLSSSVTEGIVSALGCTVDEPSEGASLGATIPDNLQTSAAINPGNSGGALVDIAGQVVGIPTLAAVDQQVGSGSAAPGIGFAIASNMVRSITSQLISHGKVADSGRAASASRSRPSPTRTAIPTALSSRALFRMDRPPARPSARRMGSPKSAERPSPRLKTSRMSLPSTRLGREWPSR